MGEPTPEHDGAVLREPVGVDAARLLYAGAARQLSDVARRLVPTDRDHTAGDYVHEALYVAKLVERLVALAAVIERSGARPTSWAKLGEVAGGITKQSAQARWAAMVEANAFAADEPISADVARSNHAHNGVDLAERLDAWYRRHAEPGDSIPGNEPRPVSAMLVDEPAASATPSGQAEPAALRMSPPPPARPRR
jgi:hypothetical protein